MVVLELLFVNFLLTSPRSIFRDAFQANQTASLLKEFVDTCVVFYLRVVERIFHLVSNWAAVLFVDVFSLKFFVFCVLFREVNVPVGSFFLLVNVYVLNYFSLRWVVVVHFIWQLLSLNHVFHFVKDDLIDVC